MPIETHFVWKKPMYLQKSVQSVFNILLSLGAGFKAVVMVPASAGAADLCAEGMISLVWYPCISSV